MSNRLFVGNLSYGTTAQNLGKTFEEIGTVQEAIILSRGSRSLGYGFVTMETPEQAKAAVDKLHERELDGRNISVAFARSERRGGFRGGRGGPRGGRGGPRGGRGGPRGGPRDGPRGGPRGGRGRGHGGRPIGPRRPRPTQPVPVNTPRLHVANLPYRTKAQELGKKFEEFGDVQEAVIVARNNRSLGFGFVTMATVEQAKKAQEALNSTEMDGRKIFVDGALPSRKEPSQTRVHVGNIPFSLKDEEFAAFFKDYEPKETTIIRSKFNNRSRGYGFVELKTAEQQQKLLKEHPQMEMNGRTAYLKAAFNRPQQQQAAPEEKKN